MSRKTRKNNILALPSRRAFGRLWHGFLIFFLMLVLMMGRSGNQSVLSVQAHMMDAVAPVLRVLASPLDALHTMGTGVKQWALVYQQNESLKAENRELLKWQALAKESQAENAQLRALLQVAPRKDAHFITASIVSEHGSSLSNAAIIGAGKEAGILVNQAVISERGLVGRVVEVATQTARMLLLTDVNSRIPVMNERTREKMLLVGKGSGSPVLGYVATDTATRKGDRLITSGDGGIFPKNIPVGVVRDSSKAMMTVEPFANIADIEYVSVVEY